MRTLLLLLSLCFVSVAEARYCNNPNCAMCNRIFGPMPGYGTRPAPQSQVFVQPQPQVFAQPQVQPAITYSSVSAPSVIPQEILHTLDPSSQIAVDKMLAILAPTSQDVLYDLGCGDGRILLTAYEEYATPGVGIEINAESAEISRQNVYGKPITIVTGDATKFDLSDATLVTMYLYPPVIKALVPNLKGLRPGTRVVSFAHPIPLPGTRKIDVGNDSFYLWIRP